jgi:TonB family protein
MKMPIFAAIRRPFFSCAAMSLLIAQTASLPAAAQEAVSTSASAAAESAIVTPAKQAQKNDLKIDIGQTCKVPAYPKTAKSYGMQGKTILKLKIDENGKIAAFNLLRSSGWRLLDMTVMQAIVECQILPPGNWIPSERTAAYWWKFDEGYTSPAVLDPASCQSSDLLRIAEEKDHDVGIVVGLYVSPAGKVADAKVQWGENEQLDQESLRIAKSCEFTPAERKGRRIGNAESLRFVPKTAQ